MPSDEELMLAVGRGDAAALEKIVARYQGVAWRTALRFLGDAAEAEDVTQEVFLRIFSAAPRYRPAAPFRTYVYRIVTHLCLDAVRKKHPAYTKDPPVSADPSPSPLEAMTDQERDEAVRMAMQGLPDRQRAAVVRRYFEGLSCREVAHVMGSTVKAVERLLARARAALEAPLGRLLSGE